MPCTTSSLCPRHLSGRRAGILWHEESGRVVVQGFTVESKARQSGMCSGDILQQVDGLNLLQMFDNPFAVPPLTLHLAPPRPGGGSVLAEVVCVQSPDLLTEALD